MDISKTTIKPEFLLIGTEKILNDNNAGLNQIYIIHK